MGALVEQARAPKTPAGVPHGYITVMRKLDKLQKKDPSLGDLTEDMNELLRNEDGSTNFTSLAGAIKRMVKYTVTDESLRRWSNDMRKGKLPSWEN